MSDEPFESLPSTLTCHSELSADGAPRHQIGEVLRRRHVEELASRRKTQVVDIEQQVARNLSFTAAWVANRARKLYFQRDANYPVFGTGATAGNVNNRRPYLPGTFAIINRMESGSNSAYDSLQMTVNRRFAGGLTVMANYTWGKSIDEMSADVSNPTAIELIDSRYRRIERGLSGFDIWTHALFWSMFFNIGAYLICSILLPQEEKEQEQAHKFGHILDAFRFGAPPHGGLALGLDRIAMLVSGEVSIREVIAFPKNNKGSDLMTDSPTSIDFKQLRELYIQSTYKEKKPEAAATPAA